MLKKKEMGKKKKKKKEIDDVDDLIDMFDMYPTNIVLFRTATQACIRCEFKM
jgi:hypothetical protein